MGVRRNKKRKHRVNNIAAEKDVPKPKLTTTNNPSILVIHRGSIGPIIPKLMADIETILSPHVVKSITVLRSTRIKDLVAAAGGLHITHTVIFTRTDNGLYMKVCSMPKGPTITFSIQQYTLQGDILSGQKRAMNVSPATMATPPSLMLYNIQPHTGPKHMRLVASSMLQLFSTFAPGKCSARNVKRCCLLDYDDETEEIALRHYVIQLKSSGTAKLVNKLLNSKKIPNLHNYDKIEDAFENVGAASESEGEEDTKVELSDIKPDLKRKKSLNKTSVKLKDTGPHIVMKVQKIEAGFLGGEVIYNRFQKKSTDELKSRDDIKEQRKSEKKERKRVQDAHVERKKEEAKAHKERCLQGMPEELRQKALENMRKKEEEEEEADSDDADSGDDDDASEEESEAQYYKDAVGEDPGEEFARRANKRKNTDLEEQGAAKKAKLSKKDKEEAELEAKRTKAKDRYKLLDQRRKTKRPRAFGKRLAKKLKTKAKERTAKSKSDKEQAEHKEKGAPKKNSQPSTDKSNKKGSSKK